MNIKTQIQIVRGVKSQLPILRSGELGYATDTNELFIGDPTDGNVLVNKNDIEIRNDIARLSTQLETIAKQGYATCSKIGLTLDDKNNNNFTLLCNAINDGYKIIVDNVYKLKCDSTNEINKDLYLLSLNNGGFNIESSVPLFNFNLNNGNIFISNLQLVGDNYVLIENNNKIFKIDKVEFHGCEINGDSSIFRMRAENTHDPDIIDFGINELKFEYNKTSNTRKNFIIVTNMPYGKISIKNNKINNFDNSYITLSVDDDHLFHDKLIQKCEIAEIENNEVRCEKSWWHVESSNIYYSFAVIKNKKVVYRYNHVEGMKSTTQVSLYDLYASSDYVISEYNTWKNNLLFLPTSINNALMKAKKGDGYRYYCNNTYIAELSFVTELGKTIDTLSLRLYDNVSKCSWVIKDNNIDCCYLAFEKSSSPINELIFNNNKVLIGKTNDSSLINATDNSNITICDNKIKVIESNGFNIINQVGAQVLNDVIIENNRMELSGSKYLFLKLYCNNFKFNNNEIKMNNSIDKAIFNGCKLNDMVMINNTFKSDDHLNFLIGYVGGNKNINNNTIIVNKYKEKSIININLDVPLLEKPQKYFLEIDSIVDNNIIKSKTSFEIFAEGVNKIKFINKANNEEVIYDIKTSNGSYTNLKFDNQPNFDLVFYNTTSQSFIFLKPTSIDKADNINFNIKTF